MTEPRNRVLSIDALRGFDMFWIIGADELIIALLKRGGWSFSPALQAQFEHVEWEGFRFYDLIFPLFLFLVGCVLPYSLEKYRATPSLMTWRVVRRTLFLILLGLIANGLLRGEWSELRFAGVLQRIGICYGAAALIFLRTSQRVQVVITAAILLGYWAILAWVPVPGGVAGDYSKAGNLAGYLDRTFLPGKILELYYGHGDNEGLLSTLPAIATAMLGVFTGNWLRSEVGPWRKVGGLAVAGVACLVVGFAWGNWFPVIKNLWTSSFVLVAGGWSLLLLGLFYALIDVLGWRRWAWFWMVIGANAITIYIAQRFIDFDHMANFFVGGVARAVPSYSPIVLVAGALFAKWLFLWFLYRQKIFLRV